MERKCWFVNENKAHKFNLISVINNEEREHPNLRRMFSDENGWPLPSNHLIKNQ